MSDVEYNTLGLKDAILLTAISVVWGLNFIVIKLGLSDFPPLLFTAVRFLACAFPAIAFIPKPEIRWRELIIVGFTLGTLVFGLLYIGMHLGLSAGLASVVMQLQVFFTVLFANFFLRERLTSASWVALSLSLLGVILLIAERRDQAVFLGLVLVLGAAVSWGAANIAIKRLPKVNMLHLMVWMSIVPPFPLLILSAIFEGNVISTAVSDATWTVVWATAYTAMLSTVGAYGIWGNMLQKYRVSLVAPFAFLVPIFGLVGAAVFLEERYTFLEVVASVLIVVGLGINVWGGVVTRTARTAILYARAGLHWRG